MIRLRVDDFPGTKPEEFYKHDLSGFKRFDQVVRKYVPEYVLGVIPKHTTDEHLRWIGENPAIITALHGIDHDERFPNEFRDHQTIDDICKAIDCAKQRLDPLVGPVRCYIPPHNVFDLKTCQALVKSGFKSIMGGPGSPEWSINSPVVKETGLHYCYSPAPLEYGRSDELLQKGSVGHLQNCQYKSDRQFVYLTLHWTWELNIGLQHLEAYLSQLKEDRQFGSTNSLFCGFDENF